MPSAVVATVAWMALALAAGTLVVVILVGRELRALSRAHTDRKWEIQGLRAELAALRRHAAERSEGAPLVEETRGARPSPSSPTAWRRRRGRTTARAPRRRPGG